MKIPGEKYVGQPHSTFPNGILNDKIRQTLNKREFILLWRLILRPKALQKLAIVHRCLHYDSHSANYHWAKMPSGVFMLVVCAHLGSIYALIVNNDHISNMP